MKKLLNLSLKKFMIYAGLVLIFSIPVYYFVIQSFLHYEYNEHKIILTPEAKKEDQFIIIGAVTILTVTFSIFLLVGFIILNRRISKSLWLPFYNSLAKIKKFDINTQQPINFEATNVAEFADLNNSLDKLISGNIAAYKQQKEFADNASHELQTPLAIVQSKLELLLQGQSLTTEQYNTIEEAMKALARVGRINKNLLLLTKIENSQYMESENINLSDLLRHSITLLTGFSETKNIQLQQKIPQDIFIKGNRILVEILLNNLIVNGIRHSNPNSSISIELSYDKLIVSNAGSVPLKEDQLFRRFASASSESPGTGLGLALIQQICKRYNWSVQYNFSNNLHLFSVQF